MTKKKEEKNIDLSDKDLERLASMVSSMNSNVSVIKVGNDKVSDTEMVERYKKSNQQLRKKIEQNIKDIAVLQLEVREAKLEAYLHSSGGEGDIIKGIKRENIKLKKVLEAKDIVLKELKQQKDQHTKEKADLLTEKRNLEKQVEQLLNSNEELKKEVQELREEVRVRIQADNRFHNMDL